MNIEAKRVQRTYLGLLLGNTLAASLIWGINTLFLLDAGLSNFQAFAANAFFSVGMLLFEIPTGVIADTWGRRTSYLLGTSTLAATTFLYYLLWQINGPFWGWALVSALLGLGFTFFSGAVEAWLVDALNHAKFKGKLEEVFGRGQMISGAAMLVGSVAGGYIAQMTSLGVPYILRAFILLVVFAAAFYHMRDLGFEPDKQAKRHPVKVMNSILASSLDYGLKNPKVRWVMLSAPFTVSVLFYAFYALQPYLLQVYGDKSAYGVAGIAAAVVAGAQILGGMNASRVSGAFKRRTTLLITSTMLSSLVLIVIGSFEVFALIVLLAIMWAALGAITTPVRQAYLNAHIPSKQRATVLSFDSLLGSAGGVPVQPALGKVADINGYGASFIVSGLFQLLALPFLLKSRLLDKDK